MDQPFIVKDRIEGVDLGEVSWKREDLKGKLEKNTAIIKDVFDLYVEHYHTFEIPKRTHKKIIDTFPVQEGTT